VAGAILLELEALLLFPSERHIVPDIQAAKTQNPKAKVLYPDIPPIFANN
jgi:hypothetical protein